ncbi:hypothetical protein CSOJ01_11898 [Colletotrichum sojae]|uniref:BTB domain-containing protein n=1 Tax=Colletotrichum sojae TaxID=2175907 RepID=A0A8H6IX20_9PEZI|nr:hypothetical protein CSOJ01_11898 [Colletotrichum sojae]
MLITTFGSKCCNANKSPETAEEDAAGEPVVELLLLSAHLRLGSGYFKRILSREWKESVTRNTEGKRFVEAEDFDAEALLMVMRMIHNLDHSVPQKVDLEMMAKIAVIVDYYDCHEPVWFIASMWINELKECLPETCNRDLSLWLLISSVFDEKEIFLEITKTAVMTSTGPLKTLDLPIRDIFIGITFRHLDRIAQRRKNAIGLMVTVLEDTFDSLLKGKTHCSYECTSALLGALMKGASRLLLHSPEEPYLGYSIESLEQALRNITTPRTPACIWRHSTPSCSLENQILDRLKGDLEKFKQGFELHQTSIPDDVEKSKEAELKRTSSLEVLPRTT